MPAREGETKEARESLSSMVSVSSSDWYVFVLTFPILRFISLCLGIPFYTVLVQLYFTCALVVGQLKFSQGYLKQLLFGFTWGYRVAHVLS